MVGGMEREMDSKSGFAEAVWVWVVSGRCRGGGEGEVGCRDDGLRMMECSSVGGKRLEGTARLALPSPGRSPGKTFAPLRQVARQAPENNSTIYTHHLPLPLSLFFFFFFTRPVPRISRLVLRMSVG